MAIVTTTKNADDQLFVDAHEAAHNPPTRSWNAQAARALPNFRPIPLDAASLAAYGKLYTQTPVTFMDKVSELLGSPTDKAEAADAVVRVRLSGSKPGVTPTQALTEADMASRTLYASTSLIQMTHDPLNVATRIAVLRGDASPMKEEPTQVALDLQSILTALETRETAPAQTRKAGFKSTGPS